VVIESSDEVALFVCSYVLTVITLTFYLVFLRFTLYSYVYNLTFFLLFLRFTFYSHVLPVTYVLCITHSCAHSTQDEAVTPAASKAKRGKGIVDDNSEVALFVTCCYVLFVFLVVSVVIQAKATEAKTVVDTKSNCFWPSGSENQFAAECSMLLILNYVLPVITLTFYLLFLRFTLYSYVLYS
jgi:hypothetical protein